MAVRYPRELSTTWRKADGEVVYYHTDDNRTIRSIDMQKIDWDNLQGVRSMPLRAAEIPPVQEVTPSF